MFVDMKNRCRRDKFVPAEFVHKRMKTVIVEIQAIAKDQQRSNKTRMIPILCITSILFGAFIQKCKLGIAMQPSTNSRLIENAHWNLCQLKSLLQLAVALHLFFDLFLRKFCMKPPLLFSQQKGDRIKHLQFTLI